MCQVPLQMVACRARLHLCQAGKVMAVENLCADCCVVSSKIARHGQFDMQLLYLMCSSKRTTQHQTLQACQSLPHVIMAVQ